MLFNHLIQIGGKPEKNLYPGAVKGATVMVVFDFPKISVTKTALADFNGEALVSYKINNRKTGTGTANVTVTVTKAGYDDVFN